MIPEWYQLSLLEESAFDDVWGMPKTSRNPIDDLVT